MQDCYEYVRTERKKGQSLSYTFIAVSSDAVKVIRKCENDVFEHTFRIGDVVEGRTLKKFNFKRDKEHGKSVYVESHEKPSSNKQSLANQIDIIYEINKTGTTPVEEDLSDILRDSTTTETEKERLIKARIGQGDFRTALITMWDGCAVTGIKTKELLIASHIKPWRKALNSERLDPFNGLLLIANLDKAFDTGLISFDNNGQIMISPLFTDAEAAGINSSMTLPVMHKHKTYLKYHREHVYKSG
ncbi:HNH endonuclease [Photobacterium damselae]|uniref:HNH nuclease domain-containing protein n=1 Tax=Photobacterium damselae subsp. damselae TaxID=85581 RepID=A0AAD3ZU84_PHODD|nr:HNH endonuclease [Photobacterium damselae]AWK84633.1 hypothetical protein BST98_21640 [Photobacterium damselae]KAB1176604.1 hypothetical protein F6450_17950 [Photobacterium damselae subsp. damselae]MBE8127647.1 HNH endonuclease [Photobacterium damselae subsp. piscicida]MCG3826498.1 HNH endonuclease [Photobacterium damselae]NVO61511.1 HNH endonuclease [Photobacterium damselae subsp. damselae]